MIHDLRSDKLQKKITQFRDQKKIRDKKTSDV